MNAALLDDDVVSAANRDESQPIAVGLPRWTKVTIALTIAVQLTAGTYAGGRVLFGDPPAHDVAQFISTRPRLRSGPISVPGDFPTIAAALGAADTGAEITIGPGEYHEQIVLKRGVRLVGVDRDRVVIRSKFNCLVAVDCGAGQVRNLTFEGLPTGHGVDTPIVALNHSRVELSECTIRSRDQQRSGIRCLNGDCSAVRQCLVENCNSGISAQDSGTDVRFTENISRKNRESGFVLADGARGVVERNQADMNGAVGIRISGRGTNAALIENTSTQNARSGIEITSAARADLMLNSAVMNKGTGILIHGEETAAQLVGNKCLENDYSGIGIQDSANARITGNKCCKNKQAGIAVFSGGSGGECENVCTDNVKASVFKDATSGAFEVERESGKTSQTQTGDLHERKSGMGARRSNSRDVGFARAEAYAAASGGEGRAIAISVGTFGEAESAPPDESAPADDDETALINILEGGR